MCGIQNVRFLTKLIISVCEENVSDSVLAATSSGFLADVKRIFVCIFVVLVEFSLFGNHKTGQQSVQ